MDSHIEENFEQEVHVGESSIPDILIDEVEVFGDSGSSHSRSEGLNLGKRARRTRSDVWKVFKRIKEEGKVECAHCGERYTHVSAHGTSTLKRHMRNCRKATQGSVIRDSSHFKQERFREMLVTAIVRHELPFSFVEYEHFRALFSYLEHRAQPICRNTAKSDVLKLFSKEKARLKSFLSKVPGRVSLTSDLWTSIATDGYISLTAHFIDEDWKLQHRLISFSLMHPPHTGIAICEKIYNLLVDWGIQHRLFCVTLDNASANTLFVDLLKNQLSLKRALLGNGKLFHIRCCAHVLNLIVGDGLKVIDKSIDKIRESVKYIKGSQSRKKKFLDCISYVSLVYRRGLRQDVPTRWNSTYLMLESILYYHPAFIYLESVDNNYKYCPTEEEWGKLQKLQTSWRNFTSPRAGS